MAGLRASISRFVALVVSLAATHTLQAREPAQTSIDIDLSWAGTRVRFDAIEADGYIFVAYYDRDRWLSLARIRIADSTVEKVRLNSQFAGWDSHNYISLALDDARRLHVTGNMHASPLIYFRGATPLAIDRMAAASMIGRDERQASYPTFLRSGDQSLLFLYRSGYSGRGDWFINRWTGTAWARINGPIFAKNSTFGHVSAYPSRFVTGPDGIYHVAVIWRKDKNVETNFRVSYARTKDFSTWTDARGGLISAPIGPENGDLVDDTGENAGLLNNPQIALDPDGRPVISYSKYGKAGTNAVTVAYRDGATWRLREVASSDVVTKLQGRGTLPESPGVGAVVFNAGKPATIAYSFPSSHHFVQQLDPATLAPVGPATVDNRATARAQARNPDPRKRIEHIVPVRRADGSTLDPAGQIVWSTQGSNRDLPFECNDEHPDACSPAPSTLRLVLFAK